MHLLLEVSLAGPLARSLSPGGQEALPCDAQRPAGCLSGSHPTENHLFALWKFSGIFLLILAILKIHQAWLDMDLRIIQDAFSRSRAPNM